MSDSVSVGSIPVISKSTVPTLTTSDDNTIYPIKIDGDGSNNGIYTVNLPAPTTPGLSYKFLITETDNENLMDTPLNETKIVGSLTAAYDKFGFSVSLDSNRMIVGVPYNHAPATDSGTAYIFYKNGESWDEIKEIVPGDSGAWDLFGYNVSISGDIAVVGSPQDEDNSNWEHGSVYIFYKNQGGTDNWGQITKLTEAITIASNRFGISVSISGNVLVVSVRAKLYAYIYYKDGGGSDNWGDLKTIIRIGPNIPTNPNKDTVSISGDIIAITEHHGSTANNTYLYGSVYLFYKDYDPSTPNTPLSDNWGKIVSLSNISGPNSFGNSVSLNTYAIVGTGLCKVLKLTVKLPSKQ